MFRPDRLMILDLRLELFEAGGLTEEESLELFQFLIDTGYCFARYKLPSGIPVAYMPPSYEDSALHLIVTGACHASA